MWYSCPPSSGGKISASELDDMIHQSGNIAHDQRMTRIRRSAIARLHAPSEMFPGVSGYGVAGSHWRPGILWQCQATLYLGIEQYRLTRTGRMRAISPETAVLTFGYSPLSTNSRAKAKVVSVKLTLCL